MGSYRLESFHTLHIDISSDTKTSYPSTTVVTHMVVRGRDKDASSLGPMRVPFAMV